MKKNYFAAVIIIISSVTLKAQDSVKTYAWVNGGAGLNSIAFGINFDANLQINNLLITARYGLNGEILGSGLSEGGVLIGYRFPGMESIVSVAGGLSVTTYQESKGLFVESVKSRNLGVVLEAQFSYIIWKFLGIGAMVYANLNEGKSIAGVSLNLFVGIMSD